jgi:hypothetical protein
MLRERYSLGVLPSKKKAGLLPAAEYADIYILVGQLVTSHLLLYLTAAAAGTKDIVAPQGKKNRSA